MGKQTRRAKREPSGQKDDDGLFFCIKKRPAASYSRMGGSHTTLGDEALDFRVRYGNGYDSFSMATGPKLFGSGISWSLKGIATFFKMNEFLK